MQTNTATTHTEVHANSLYTKKVNYTILTIHKFSPAVPGILPADRPGCPVDLFPVLRHGWRVVGRPRYVFGECVLKLLIIVII